MNIVNIKNFQNILNHFSFETPTLEGVLSENGDTFSALEMQKGVNNNIKILIIK